MQFLLIEKKIHVGCTGRFLYRAVVIDDNKESGEKVRENARKLVTDTARCAHKGSGGIMHGWCFVNFGTQNSVSFRAFSDVAHPLTSARSDKSECIYTKESRLRHEEEKEKGWERELAWCQCLMKLSFPTRSLCHSSLPYSISLLAHGARPHDSLFINAIGKTVEFASRHDLRRHGLYGTSSPFQETHQNQRKSKMILFWFLTSINSQIL